MSFIAKLFTPKMPPVPQFVMPEVRNRKGRRSTILTGSAGLNEIDEEELNQKTLLGGN